MATTLIPTDFKEFLRLLNAHGVEYLVVGGYAVIHHGYPRATGDIDFWMAIHPDNADRLLQVLEEFGFGGAGATRELLLTPGRVVRMGRVPVRIDVLNRISGVDFQGCYERRTVADFDGVEANVISIEDLRINKKASGRLKDLADLENLP